MQVLVWLFRFAIVLVLVWFAVRNSGEVTLNGLPGQEWKVSLVFVLLIAFVGGVVIGLLAWVPTVVRQRRELSRLRKAASQAEVLGAVPPPPADPPRADVHGI
ncbi:hypothetical protein BWI17_13685 [Betaproteobacteria bacterium GR16-43]|nr:hypothetical protein BWI17_13685 [Betaproteobacteria bacterium GR16-43]